MKRILPFVLVPVVAAVVIVLIGAIYVVDVRQRALVLRFGEVVRVADTPGIRFKLPIIDDVVKYDARILGLATQPMEITPLDDRRLVVDAFARWQITDVVRFRRAVGRLGEDGAYQLLEPILTNAIRGALGSVPSTTVLSDDRTTLMNQIRDSARAEADALGVQVIDVRLTRTDLPAQNLNATYARMRAEREREAADEIGRGNEAAQRVRAAADRTVVELTSEARRRAEIIRGEAEARRNAIFADAYGRDPEFFAFTRSLSAYEASFAAGNTSFVLSPTGEFFDYLRAPGKPSESVAQAAEVQRALEAQMEAAGVTPEDANGDLTDMPELSDPNLRAPSVQDLTDDIPGLDASRIPSLGGQGLDAATAAEAEDGDGTEAPAAPEAAPEADTGLAPPADTGTAPPADTGAVPPPAGN